MIRAFAIALVVLFAGSASAQSVTFPSVAVGSAAAGPEIKGWIYKPAPDLHGPGPFRAIILAHSCAGTSPHTDVWGRLLVSWGYLVLAPDSFGARGTKAVCTTPGAVTPNMRVVDIAGALDYLATRPDVLKGKVGIIGHSHGGSTTLRSARKHWPAQRHPACRRSSPSWRTTRETPAERLDALARLKEAEFTGSVNAHRAEYTEALRAAARSQDENLRIASLEVLVVRKAEVARYLLVRSLRGTSPPLMPTAKALQLLGQDDHSEAVAVASDIARSGTDTEARGEALRVLASSPAAAGLLETILSDKSQPSQLRSLSEIGLSTLAPARFAVTARSLVDDDDEDDNVRAACLTALTHLDQYAEARNDAGLAERVKRLSERTPSANLRSAAERFTLRTNK